MQPSLLRQAHMILLIWRCSDLRRRQLRSAIDIHYSPQVLEMLAKCQQQTSTVGAGTSGHRSNTGCGI